MLNSLREATASLHKRLEEHNLANRILDNSISLEEYKFLLYQNYLAYSIAEREVAVYFPDFKMDKAVRIKQDLTSLGTRITENPVDFDFRCNTEAEAIGAAYVIEGSAMGGMVIGRELKNCPALAELPDQAFFSGNREAGKDWNKFLKLLRNRNFTEEEVDIAAVKAVETFRLFEKAFNLEIAHS